jgi:hypothetical protein
MQPPLEACVNAFDYELVAQKKMALVRENAGNLHLPPQLDSWDIPERQRMCFADGQGEGLGVLRIRRRR